MNDDEDYKPESIVAWIVLALAVAATALGWTLVTWIRQR